MSVEEISELHNRYVRLSDKFKSIWTYHQFAQGVFKNLINLTLPYNIDFQSVYQPIKKAQSVIQSARPESARELLDAAGRDLENVIRQLLETDGFVSASIMRRFFERLDRQDDKIIFYLIKFYLYAGEVGDDQLDKLDFLLTRIAEDYIDERSEYAPRDSLALRQTFQSLLSVRDADSPPQSELLGIISRLSDLKGEIERAEKFDDLSDQNLVGRLREIKHTSGNLFYHPDVLLAIVQANISMKNRSRTLYGEEEKLVLEHAQRLLENERNLKDGFAASDPGMTMELERFKEFKQKFDESRAASNMKFDSLSRLKESMKSLLGDFDAEEVLKLDQVEPVIERAERMHHVEEVFGDDPVLNECLEKIVEVLAPWADRVGPAGRLAEDVVTDLRLEKWEAEAWFRLSRREAMDPLQKERDRLYMRAAALRLKINEEAKELAQKIDGPRIDHDFLISVRTTLATAERLDASFGSIIQGVGNQWQSDDLRRLHRSRIRLFREFSGLWLLYDQHMEEDAGGAES